MMQLDQVVQRDAIEFLREIESGSVDMIFTDPPYNLGLNYADSDDALPEGDYLAWCKTWLDECARVLVEGGSLFLLHIPYYAVPLAAHLHGLLKFQHWIAWKAASRAANKALMPEHYALLYYSKGEPKTRNIVRRKHEKCRHCGRMLADYGGKQHLIHPEGPQISDIWTDIGRLKATQRGEHPCALPPRLVERCILIASDEGDLVVDPFGGTGTTAVVARNLGRHYLTADLSERYVRMARKRLAIPYNVPLIPHVPAIMGEAKLITELPQQLNLLPLDGA